MAALQCDICGGKLLGKPGGIFECDSCGMEYTTEWAKAKIQEIKGTVKVEGTVQVAGTVKVDGPIKVEGAATLPNLIARGFMAIESGHFDDARQTFGKALEMDPECGDAHLGIAIASRQYRDRQSFWTDIMSYAIDEPTSLTKARECSLTEPYHSEMERYKAFLAKEAADAAEALRRGEENRSFYAALREKYAPARALLGNDYYEATISEGYYLGDKNSPWREVIAISNSMDATAGILPDGSVIAQFKDYNYKYNTYILNTAPAPKAVKVCACGEEKSTGHAEVFILRQDGTVTAFDKDGQEPLGTTRDLKTWTDIVDIAATQQYGFNIIGVKKDGTLVANSEHLLKDQEDLRDIAQVVSGRDSDFAFLTNTGRVILQKHCKNCAINSVSDEVKSAVTRIEKWTDIIQISFLYYGTYYDGEVLMGLKADGTVVAEGLDKYGCKKIAKEQQKLQSVQDAVAIKGLSFLLKDGHIMMVSSRYEKSDTLIQKKYGSGEKQPIRLFEHIDTLEAERRAIIEKREALIRHRTQLENEITSLKATRASLGIFASKQKKEIDAQIAELEAKLKELN